MYEWPKDFWEHQTRGCIEVVKKIIEGKGRILYTAPCGTGKTRCMAALTEWASDQWWKTAWYTHRRLLCNQMSGVLNNLGIDHGMRASGYKTALLRSVQICMTQTEYAAVFRNHSRQLHEANLVLTDEIHGQGGSMIEAIHQHHHERGANIVAITATPIDIAGTWDDLVVACTTSEGRACGALVLAKTYCPDEPEMQHIKRYCVGEDLTDAENRKAIMRPGIFGRVYDNFVKLNPKQTPTILFAPDIPGSIYFAEQFNNRGIASAHIDAKQIWRSGECIVSTDENREEVLQDVRRGHIKVLCNRFVLREGLDLPEVGHVIFACVVGSLRSYLQMGGRGIRAHPSTPDVTFQDHGANYRRHGDINDDYEWVLGMTGKKITGMRQERMRDSPKTEPIRCPQCGFMRNSGASCPVCGYRYSQRSRVVVQINGNLKRVDGPAYKPRRVKQFTDTERKWLSMVYRAKNPKWDATFRQAAALFFVEEGYYPPSTLPMMPVDQADWFEKVNDVPRERLIQ